MGIGFTSMMGYKFQRQKNRDESINEIAKAFRISFSGYQRIHLNYHILELLLELSWELRLSLEFSELVHLAVGDSYLTLDLVDLLSIIIEEI